jgi:hypothetical protein
MSEMTYETATAYLNNLLTASEEELTESKHLKVIRGKFKYFKDQRDYQDGKFTQAETALTKLYETKFATYRKNQDDLFASYVLHQGEKRNTKLYKLEVEKNKIQRFYEREIRNLAMKLLEEYPKA